ncbi:MAG: helix-turn-helix domain-containing protein [Actinomycetota bacterium]|nr:helix-turn-helix domain-containing protein [Actinomycetota bacterium]
MKAYNTPELLTLDQAAAFLGTTVRFAQRLVSERRIRVYKVGRHVRIARRDLEDFLEAGVRESRDQ